MQLYTTSGSRGLRATWTVCELGIADQVELVVMPFPPRAHVKGYFAINSLGTIPALALEDGYVMTESSAIAAYLAERFGADSLAVPPDHADRAPYLDFLHHADATLTFPQTVYMRFAIFEKDRGLGEAGEAYGTWFSKRLQKVDQRLAERDYLCANRFTAADIAIGYALYLSTQVGLSHHLSPRLVDWLAQLEARPAFQAAIAWEKSTPVRSEWALEE